MERKVPVDGHKFSGVLDDHGHGCRCTLGGEMLGESDVENEVGGASVQLGDGRTEHRESARAP